MKSIAVLLLAIVIAWTPLVISTASGGGSEQKQPSGAGNVWQEFKDDWIEIGKEARDAGVEVGRSIKKEFQEMPENMRKGYQETKEALKKGTGGNSRDTSPNQQ